MPTAPALPAPVALTGDGAIDVAAALAADDATLTAAIADAQRRMRDSRHNRAGLFFSDAKLADISLRAERTRRQVAAHQAASRPALPRLHPCGTGCTNSAHPVSECACECRGANHQRSVSVVEPQVFPRRTVWADVYRADGVSVGFDAIEDHFGTWSVRQLADVGVNRNVTAVLAHDLPDRATAEARCLALVEVNTPAWSAAA